MARDKARKLSDQVGRQVRAIRTRAGVRQEDIARAARASGLDWTAATVAALETGRRDLSAEELLWLPHVIYGSTAEDVRLADLLPAKGQVQLGPRVTVSAKTLRGVVNGRTASEGPKRAPGTMPTWGGSKTKGVAEEATIKAARRIGVSPATVAEWAEELWGRSLAEERDRRIGHRSDDLDRRSLQAVRGHITRELLAELTTRRGGN